MANSTTPGEDPKAPKTTTRREEVESTIAVGGEGEGQRAATESEAAAERARNQAQAANAQIQAAREAAAEAAAEQRRALAFNAAKQESIRVALQDDARREREEIDRLKSTLDLTRQSDVDRINTKVEDFNKRFGEGGEAIQRAQKQAEQAAQETQRRVESAFKPAEEKRERANVTIETANRLARRASEKAEQPAAAASGRFADSVLVQRQLGQVQINEAETLAKAAETLSADKQRALEKQFNDLLPKVDKFHTVVFREGGYELIARDPNKLDPDLKEERNATLKAYERYTQDAAALTAVSLKAASEIQKARVEQLINEPGTDDETVRRLKQRNEDARQAVESTESKWRVLSRGLSSGTFGVPAPATEKQARSEGRMALETVDRVLSAPGEAVKRIEVPVAVPGGTGASGLGGGRVVRVRPLDWSAAKEAMADWIEANAGSPGAATVFRMAAPDNPVDLYLFVNAAGQVAQLSYKGSRLLIKGYGETALKAEDAAVAASKAIREAAGGAPAVAKQIAVAPLVGLTGGGGRVARVAVKVAEPQTLRTIIDPREGTVLIRGSEAATPFRESARAVRLEGSRLKSRLPAADAAKVGRNIRSAEAEARSMGGTRTAGESGFDDEADVARTLQEIRAAKAERGFMGGTRAESESGVDYEADVARALGLLEKRDAALTSSSTTAAERQVLLGQKTAATEAEKAALEAAFGFKVSPERARDILRSASESRIESVTRDGRSIYAAPELSQVQRAREEVAATRERIKSEILALERQKKAVPQKLKKQLAKAEASQAKLEKLSVAEVAAQSIKPVGVQIEKVSVREKPREGEQPVKDTPPVQEPERQQRREEQPIERQGDEPVEKAGEQPKEGTPPADAPPPPKTPPPKDTPGGEPPPGEAIKPKVTRLPEGGFEVRFDPPEGTNVPAVVVLRRGVVEQRINILTRKRTYGKDLSAAVPNNPRISPAKSLRIEGWGNTKRRRIRITDPDEPVVGVVDTRKRTIRFTSKRGFEGGQNTRRPRSKKKRFRKS